MTASRHQNHLVPSVKELFIRKSKI